MRFGIVGLLPQDPREISKKDLDKIKVLGATGACFHIPSEILLDWDNSNSTGLVQLYKSCELELAQLGVGYNECLFDPDTEVRARVRQKIFKGCAVGRDMKAEVVLIRTGSLSKTDLYSPTFKNHDSECLKILIEELSVIAEEAERFEVTVVIETHYLTILGTPELNRKVIKQINSKNLKVVMDYVNHFQSWEQVCQSSKRINFIYDIMGDISGIAHIKDLIAEDGFVVHLNEAAPGKGILDLITAIQRWDSLFPDGYMLVEHLPDEAIPEAARNVHDLAAKAGVQIH